MEDFDLVVGIHSIAAAIKNSDRNLYHLYTTEDALSELKKVVNVPENIIKLCSSHKIQEEAKNYYKQLDLEYQRVPSGVFLTASQLQVHDVTYLYSQLESKEGLKILALDQITDVHNAAAILRTASFYGVDLVIIPDKKSFGLTPSFFRIASGAAEFVPLVGVSKLTKTVTKLKEQNVLCLALSEHASGDLSEELIAKHNKGLCLVLGREDVGISHAVMRLIDHHISLDSQGDIQSLNVSIAAAISMEKCFAKN